MMGQFLICIHSDTDSYKINSQFKTLLRQIKKLKMCSRKELIDKF